MSVYFAQGRMGASLSTPDAPTVRAEAMMAVPPQGCPMHQEAQPVKGAVSCYYYIIISCYVIIFNEGFQNEHSNLLVCICLCSVPTLRVSHASSSACKRYQWFVMTLPLWQISFLVKLTDKLHVILVCWSNTIVLKTSWISFASIADVLCWCMFKIIKRYW